MNGININVFPSAFSEGSLAMDLNDILIEPMKPHEANQVSALIKQNLEGYQEAGTVLASMIRRLSDLNYVYSAPGARFFIARDNSQNGKCIGGAGLGSLHGLPVSEGVGEVRDLVVDQQYRGFGIGAKLLKRCIEEALRVGYKRLYLETTPQMENAQKLFIRYGFRPVEQLHDHERKSIQSDKKQVPCYFILDAIKVSP